jgi:hypothetical protein
MLSWHSKLITNERMKERKSFSGLFFESFGSGSKNLASQTTTWVSPQVSGLPSSMSRTVAWANLDYKKAHLGTRWKANPFGGASHAKGINSKFMLIIKS